MTRLRMLLVDDEPIARRVMREELNELDLVEVIGEAENGVQALDLICRLKPDVIFLDLRMPEISGFEVIRKLERLERPPAIVIVTACDEDVRALGAVGVKYLLKPVSKQQLERCVNHIQELGSDQRIADFWQLREIALMRARGAPE